MAALRAPFIKPCQAKEAPLAEAALAIATLPAAASVASTPWRSRHAASLTPPLELGQPVSAVAVVVVGAVAYSLRKVRGRKAQRWRSRLVALSQDGEAHAHCGGHSHDSHAEEGHDGHSHKAHDSHSHDSHSHDSHSHDSHSHDSHSHDSHSHDSHSHDSHSHDSHSHDSHSHGCCGHGHSHGEVPEWLPGRRGFQRLSDLSRTKASIIGVTSLFVFSLLPALSFPGVVGAALRTLRLAGPLLVYVVYGLPAVAASLQHAAQLDIHFLMTLAAFASAAIGHSHEGAMLLLLFALSEVLEEKLSLTARASLDALGKMCPETVRRLPAEAQYLADAQDGKEVKVLELREGDRIFVRAGEVVPVDGRILDGVSQLGMSHLTGEPLPQAVSPGDRVTSGATNTDGALVIEVQRRAEESTLQRLAKLTATAKVSRPKLVTLVDAVADRWSFAVVISTMIIAVAPPLLWHAPMGSSLYRSLVWLITASPCALILATPLVYVSGLSVAASNGVLLKGGRTLDALAVANGVAFDKTGTLTTGTPVLQSTEEIGSAKKQVLDPVPIAASLGQLSAHPVSRAMVAALPKDQQTYQVTDFQMVAGDGVTGSVQLEHGVHTAVMGRPEFVSEQVTGSDEALAKSLRARSDAEVQTGGNVMLALALFADSEGEASPGGEAEKEGEAETEESHKKEPEKKVSRVWLFHLEDGIKPSAPEVVSQVAKRGPVYLLTGDRHANAVHTVEKVGTSHFDSVHADLRPEEKLAKVQEYNHQLRHKARAGSPWRRLLRSLGASMGGLIMVGDGINDAPALAAATAGVCLEAQADGALQSNAVDGSDVLILRRAGDPQGDSDLRRVAWIISLSKKARAIVIQNICLALTSIIGASSVTLFSGMPLWLGVILHEGTTMLVGLNSLRLFRSAKVKLHQQ